MSTIDTKVQINIAEIMKKTIDQLSPEEIKARLQHVEHLMDLASPAELAKLGPDEPVWITVPFGPMGDVYRINEIPYSGRCKVAKRVAKQLSYMVSESWKIERERLMSRTNSLHGALLRGEELAKIERYNEILSED